MREKEEIAAFMGAEIMGSSWRLSKESELRQYLDHYPADMELPFDTDWRWLMPVVQKLEKKTNKAILINASFPITIQSVYKVVAKAIAKQS